MYHKINIKILITGVNSYIGDSVAVSERNKGYGKRLLALGLEKCRDLGIERVLITCKDTNVASRKCIIVNGGQYEDTRKEGEGINLERYWIDLNKKA